MKRSEAIAIQKARQEWELEYTCISPVCDDDGNFEEHFSHSGCDVCPDSLAGTVVDVIFRSVDDVNKGLFGDDRIYDGAVCGDCLCYLVNGDDSHLDYYVTEEDTK